MAKRYGGLCPNKSEVRLIQELIAATSCMDLDTADSEPGRNANACPKLGKLNKRHENVRIGGILTFFGFLKWIPIGAAGFVGSFTVCSIVLVETPQLRTLIVKTNS